MFQYTRTFVINEDIDSAKVDSAKGLVEIPGVATYKTGKDETGWERVLAYTEVAHVTPVAPTMTFAFTPNASADQRIEVRINLRRATDAAYANDLHARMSKPFIVEAPAGSTAAQVVKLLNSVLKCQEVVYAVATNSGNNITITGTDAHQILNGSVSVAVPAAINDHEGAWGAPTKFTEGMGTLGIGTYENLIKDLRLPTMENVNYFSPNKLEMPVPGVKYQLIEFNYNSGIRNIGGSGVVGQYDRSITKHRFWVNTALITGSSKIKTALAGLKPAVEPTSLSAK